MCGTFLAASSALDSGQATNPTGIPITTALAPVWGPGDEWTISEEPLVQIGAVAEANVGGDFRVAFGSNDAVQHVALRFRQA